MKIQSLSVVVPAGCPNNCKFCVAHQHRGDYPNMIAKSPAALENIYLKDYIRRMEFARDNGCNTAMLTSDGEVLLNENFISKFADINSRLERPFRKIELQASGYGLDKGVLRWLRNDIGVSTIALSINSFEDNTNWRIQGEPKHKVHISTLCEDIQKFDLSLRLCLNMSDLFGDIRLTRIFGMCKKLGANQVTFRKLYASGDSPEADWVREHEQLGRIENGFQVNWWEMLQSHIESNGRALQRLPFGAVKYDIDGISTVVDTNCMDSEDISEDLKYMILRPDCRLYSHWDTKGSLVF